MTAKARSRLVLATSLRSLSDQERAPRARYLGTPAWDVVRQCLATLPRTEPRHSGPVEHRLQSLRVDLSAETVLPCEFTSPPAGRLSPARVVVLDAARDNRGKPKRRFLLLDVADQLHRGLRRRPLERTLRPSAAAREAVASRHGCSCTDSTGRDRHVRLAALRRGSRSGDAWRWLRSRASTSGSRCPTTPRTTSP